MAIRIPEKELDPFAAPIAGQSLTDTPGKMPYERPPQIVDPEQAFNILKDSMDEPEQMRSILNIIDAGLSAETVASSFVMKMFSEGIITPDIAELIKPPIVAHIVDLATEAGIEDITVVNELPQEGMTEEDSLELMSKLRPEKSQKLIGDSIEEREMIEQATAQFPVSQESPEMGTGFIDRETV